MNMRRIGELALALVGLACLPACHQGVGPSNLPGGRSLVLDDGAWIFAVDRVVPAGSIVVAVPDDPIPDSAYAPIAGGAYLLDVSEGGRRVVVTTEPPLVAGLNQADEQRLMYRLVEGTFAGGRIVVWTSSSGLQAELTIYGSGVPVIRSERGSLRRRE
jgi:hypothetical protein